MHHFEEPLVSENGKKRKLEQLTCSVGRTVISRSETDSILLSIDGYMDYCCLLAESTPHTTSIGAKRDVSPSKAHSHVQSPLSLSRFHADRIASSHHASTSFHTQSPNGNSDETDHLQSNGATSYAHSNGDLNGHEDAPPAVPSDATPRLGNQWTDADRMRAWDRLKDAVLRGAMVGLGLRGGLNIVSLALHLLRRKQPSGITSALLKSMGGDTARYAAFFGSFAGIVVAVDEGLQAVIGAPIGSCSS